MVSRKQVLAVLATTAVGIPALSADAAWARHRCGHMGTVVSNIHATNASCKTARRVVRANLRGKQQYRGFHCHSVLTKAIADVTCRKQVSTITFTINGGRPGP